MVHPCDCEGFDCANTPQSPIFGNEWSCCPYPYLRSQHWATVCYLLACADVCPLAGWPESYSAGTVHALSALRREREEKRARDHSAEIARAQRRR